jgi:putative peptidoglycan lipid II flippase
MSLIKSTATIGGYTLISRVLGFARDVTIASVLGASMYADAFFVAFRLPNYLRRLFAEGAFNSAFVPMFVRIHDGESREEATRFAGEAMSYLLMVLLIVTGLFMIFMPWIMVVLAPGFSSEPDKFALTVQLTRITMPYIVFISLVSLLGGVLNSVHKFAAAAATPIIMNLCLIIVPWIIRPLTPSGAHALAIAVTVSGVMQWLWLVWFCRKENMLPKLVRPRMTPYVKQLLLIIAPVALGAGVAQVNLLIDTIIATMFDSGVSYLYYADRISELPLAVIGIAVGTALLPMLSKHVREGKHEEAYHTQNRAIELALFLSMPSAVALLVIAGPIITTMFQRGAFTPADSLATTHVLMAFALGLPAFILVKILAPGFYANQDTKTPFKIATLCVVINLVFNLLLMGPLKYVGMALATSIASWVNVTLMTQVLIKRRWFMVKPSLYVQLAKTAVACATMAAALQLSKPFIESYMSSRDMVRFVVLIGVAGAGGAVYFVSAYALNILNMQQAVRNRLLRKRVQ